MFRDRLHRALVAAVLQVALLVAGVASAEPGTVKTVRLASLFWPPYTGAELAGGGASTEVIRAALASQGIRLEVDFLPWSRAVQAVTGGGSEYAGYFPEYYSADIAQRCNWSATIGESPLGLVHPQSDDLQWQTVADLAPLTIGVVQDYVNTLEFDHLVARGVLKVESTTSDQQNILKVASGRIDAAVIDGNVLEWLGQHDKEVASVIDRLAFHPHLLVRHKLFVCFRPDADTAPMLQALNTGLAQGGPR